ncbi:hypothetical protein J3A83DRAFT_4365119 [Scleroderma citrinum]
MIVGFSSLFRHCVHCLSDIQTIGIVVCSCITAVQQLLQMGYFPCAPLAPTLAVSLKLLNLVKHLFVHIPPNISAWCEALQSYLGSMGYSVDSKVRLLFSNAYHWHCILEITVDEYVQQKWPSEYLCSCCPLCFCHWKDISQDSSFEVDAIVCIDACFTQKHHSGQQDDPVNPTSTVFLDQDVVDAMEDEVEELQGAQSSLRRKRILRSVAQTELDQYEQGMKIPVSVLDGCNESFMAADEKHQKASTCFFSDTGVMALLCHHDCVIHLVNMKSTGKKQHYALALIKALFSHLPEDFCVGILYDIGCQLDQSCRKWGFLRPWLPQISFAISWPCQLIYHPHKQQGFGLSDGEGCERFWSAIKSLIQSFHVSGVSAQTQPAPRHSQKAGENAVRQIIVTHRLLESYEAKLQELEKQLLLGTGDLTNLEIHLTKCHSKIAHFRQGLQKQTDCHKLQSSAYLQLQVNVCALKTCIRDCLHQKKFELERLEHSYQSTVNEQKLHDHTEASVKCHEPGIQKLGTTYNNVCIHMAALVHQGKAPQGSVAPLPISWDGLFRLDDIGLGDGIDGQPPAWLANERVQLGIKFLLELKCCEEKESHILQEKKVLTEWFSEEWS